MTTDLVQRYVCSICWGQLIDDGESVKCANYPEHEGFVTRSYAETRKGESTIEAIEAKQVLRNAGILPRKSEEQLLKELGFGG